MKSLILLVLIASFIKGNDCYSQNSMDIFELENDSLIIWTKNRKLVTSDFKAHEKITEIGLEAYSSTGFHLIKEHDYKVIASFDKNLSRLDTEVSQLLLQHEQLHFDIAELFARKTRKEIYNLKLKMESLHYIDYKMIYNDFLKEYTEYQSLYDYETAHSVLVDEQKRWNEKVAKKLEELNEFSLIIEVKD